MKNPRMEVLSWVQIRAVLEARSLGHVIYCIPSSVRYADAVCHQWMYPVYQSVITRGVMYLRREVHR